MITLPTDAEMVQVASSTYTTTAAPFIDHDGTPDRVFLTTRADGMTAPPGTHPNGVIAIDHVVLMSPDLDRTVEVLAGVGLEPRRQRDAELGGRPIRQIFFRLGEVIVEVVVDELLVELLAITRSAKERTELRKDRPRRSHGRGYAVAFNTKSTAPTARRPPVSQESLYFRAGGRHAVAAAPVTDPLLRSGGIDFMILRLGIRQSAVRLDSSLYAIHRQPVL